MEKLQEIVRIVTRHRLKKIEIFNDYGQNGDIKRNNYYRLYHGIKNKSYLTDEDASLDIYSCMPDVKSYQMLKSRVKNRLLNTLFFLDVDKPEVSAWHRAWYKCNRDIYSAAILMHYGARSPGIPMLKNALKRAEKYHLYDLVMIASTTLRYHFSLTGRPKEREKYNRLLNRSDQILIKEHESWAMYEYFVVRYARSKAPKPELGALAAEYAKKLNLFRKKYDTFSLNWNYFRLKIIQCQIANDHKSTIRVCDEAENYLDTHTIFDQNVRRGELSMSKMDAYTRMRDYANGRKYADACTQYYTPGSNNWLRFLDYYFILTLQSGEIYKAVEILKTVVNHQRFEHLGEVNVEKWEIYQAYLHYALQTNLNNSNIQNNRAILQQFNMDEFLKKVPEHSNDKRGLNIAILVLQILHLIEKEDFIGIIDRVDALKAYSSRHLRKHAHYRTNCFIRAILTMEKEDFDLNRTKSLTQKYMDKLSNTNAEYSDVSDLEIIPYEDLWKNVIFKLHEVQMKHHSLAI